MDRARTEATGRWPLEVPPDEEIYTYPRRAIREHKNAAFVSGALWAVYQEPTDEEVEAACRAFYEATNPHMDPSMQLSWDRLIAGSPDVAENYRRAIMPALLAAQKVRAGQ